MQINSPDSDVAMTGVVKSTLAVDETDVTEVTINRILVVISALILRSCIHIFWKKGRGGK